MSARGNVGGVRCAEGYGGGVFHFGSQAWLLLTKAEKRQRNDNDGDRQGYEPEADQTERWDLCAYPWWAVSLSQSTDTA
jgi:hypothetical protein